MTNEKEHETPPKSKAMPDLFQLEFTRMQQELARLTQLTNAQAMRRPSAKPDKPASYAGERAESIDTWLFQMEQYLRLAHMPYEEWAGSAASYLKRHAASWWMVEYQR